MFSVNLLHRGKAIASFIKNSATSPVSRLSFQVSCRSFPLCKTFSPVLTKNTLASNASLLFRKLVTQEGTITLSQRKIVGYWLLGCSGMVAAAVVLGGITRLTESGLSMVTWRLLGEKMPRTHEEWVEEFARYQQYPEYKLLKRDISLQEFKQIWYMEFAHRTWGRITGFTFLVPAAVFLMRGYVAPALKPRIYVFTLLIGLQGLLGWYMVKSGLEDRFHEEADVPRVSQYRLAAHLGLAFVLYSGLLWSALDHLLPVHKLASFNITKKFKVMVHSSKALVFLTALSGAFVAGLDAGLVYNSFPKMGDKWIPDDILSLSPIHINFTENPVTVQFYHRVLGTLTLGIISGLWLLSRKCYLPPRARIAVHALAGMGALQVLLGISTLVHYVPTPLAAAHQSGSLILLSFALWLSHELRYLKYVPK